MEKLPFEEKWIAENISIRTFSPNIPDQELKWHIDKENRIIEPMNDNDWEFQFDNYFPQKINKAITVSRGEWHRLVKGTTDLIIKITRF